MDKVVGGFTALGLAVVPIDLFVEHILIKRIVNPFLGMMERRGSER